MKKFIPGLLALLACSCLATGCSLDGLFGKNNNSSSESSGSTTTEYDVEGAKTTLQSKYREDVNKFDPRADYEVLNNWTYLGQTYTVTWSVSTQNNSTDTVVLTDEGDVTLVEINKLLSADVNYTLTATLTAPDGTTAKATIPTTAGKVNQYIADPITADPVADTEYKLYIYQAQEREDLYLFGGMDGYYFASTQDLESAKTVKVEANATTTDVANDFFMYYVDGEITKYLNVVPRDTDASKVNVSFTDEPVSSWVYSAEAGTMLTTTNGKTYFLGTYDYHDTFSASEYPKYKDNFKACLVTISDRAEIADSVRVTNTLGELSFGSVVAGVHTAKLPLLGELYPEAKITWSLGEGTTAASINDRGNRLTTVDVSEATEITLTATVQSGNVTETKAFAITVVPDTEAGILAGVAALEKGEDFQNEVSLTGQVTKIVTEYNSEKGTITFDMKVGDQTVQGYSAKPGDGISLANLKAGDTVTITGILTNYDDTIEFEYGSLVVALQEGTSTPPTEPEQGAYTEMSIPEALAAADGTLVEVSGTVCNIKEDWSSYNNMSVTIKDANDNELYVFRMVTQVELGDIITIKGEVGSYNGSKQIAKGATATITGHDDSISGGATYTEMSITDANAAADGTLVKVSGTVCEIAEAWSSYNNMSVTIKDANDNKLYVFRMVTQVKLGDIITIQGAMATYSGNRQIGQGATAEITGHDDSFSIVYTEMSIADALVAADNTFVKVSGHIVKVDYAWSASSNNMSVTIRDAAGEQLYVYKLGTQVALGDVITIQGKMSTYNNARQIAQGATATITGTCSYNDGVVTTESTCKDAGVKTYTCSVCGGTKTEAIDKLAHTEAAEWSKDSSGHWNACTNEYNCGAQLNFATHTYESDLCKVCGFAKPTEGETPVTETIELDFVTNFSTYASAWTSTYGEHSVNFTDVGGSGDGKVIFDRANKQDPKQQIVDRPVIAASNKDSVAPIVYVTVDLGSSNKTIKSVTFDLQQWGTKTLNDIHIEYTVNGTDWVSCSDAITTPGELSSTAIPSGATSVRLSVSTTASSNVQVGLSAITLTVT